MAEKSGSHAISTKEMLCMGKVKRREEEEWGRHTSGESASREKNSYSE